VTDRRDVDLPPGAVEASASAASRESQARARHQFIVYPVLFALLPILFLYSHNMRALQPAQLAAPLLIALAASVVAWGLARLLVRDRVRAALVATLFWIWFFAFGALHGLATRSAAANLGEWKTTIFVAAYWAALLVGVGLLSVQRRGLTTASSILNIMAIVLVAWHVLSIAGYQIRRAMVSHRVRQAGDVAQIDPVQAGALPNMYYIILDGYARDDVLRDFYHYDNTEFLSFLRSKGFHVARHGKANYCYTPQSLASSLNFQYLNDLARQVGYDSNDVAPLARMISDNRLFRFLRRQGYTIAAFSSEYEPVDNRNVDIYLDGVPDLSEFQRAIVESTPLALAFGSGRRPNRQPHAQRVLYTLHHLPDTLRLAPPYFVFAHVMCPHPPFVFDANGRIVQRGQANRITSVDRLPAGTRPADYIDQVRFVNREVTRVVEQLLSRARWPTVIVIQGDHGVSWRTGWRSAEQANMRERLGVLIACYLPGDGDGGIDDNLSPVNIFRIILNRYCGTKLPRLPDESYFCAWNQQYRFVRVTDRVDPPVKRSGKPTGKPVPRAQSIGRSESVP
jgi:hypothetical protein